ncbi:hypothetical protein ABVB69_38635, partial [Streptomyces sp. NPDC000349]|uniref:hypothetical protein n=1 Tax=Streptomyces sp. NPDC000349 TaxID=3154249 RepID=UPI003369E968
NRTPRRLPLIGLQPHLLETPQEAAIMIVLRAPSGKIFQHLQHTFDRSGRGGRPLEKLRYATIVFQSPVH